MHDQWTSMESLQINDSRNQVNNIYHDHYAIYLDSRVNTHMDIYGPTEALGLRQEASGLGVTNEAQVNTPPIDGGE